MELLKRLVLPLCLLALIAAPGHTQAPSNAAEYQVKAAFLYKFCLYIEWPASAFANADSPIVVGVAGPDTLLADLENVTRGHAINGRTLQIKRVEPGTDLAALHMLFVAQSHQAQLGQIVSQAQKLPLLLVTEHPASLDDGGIINFDIQDGRIRFDVALNSANRQGLRLGAPLLKVARTVRGGAVQ